ncbi:MAG: hypothetical protein IPM53_19290 [Anaerolineaceae bacterium]|nr:hypothetical protein [Anaerolineaceae bacterium]
MKRLILILLIPLFVLACGAAEDSGGELVSYTSPNYPITFMMPERWALSDNEDSITIATAESLLLANTVVDGARINITVTPGFFMGNTNVSEVIDTAVRQFREQEGVTVIQEMESKSINNQSAVEIVLRGPDTQGNEVILRYLVLESLASNQTAVIAAVHDASKNGRYGQLMADIVNSIELGGQ